MMLRRNNLAEDMEMDILLRLPVKSLVRFRCVSKSWCARFQNQLFITNHYLKQTNKINNNDYTNISVLVSSLSRTRQEPLYFSLLDRTPSLKENIYLPLSKDFSFPYPRILGPCNGLICLWNCNEIILWNPATREFKHLPKSHIQPPPITQFTNFKDIGFGFDSKTDDYKVICIFTNHCDNRVVQQVDLYTLSTNSWRQVEIPSEFLFCDTPSLDTYVNQVYHWEARVSECIISFDMAEEVFSRLPLPFNFSPRFNFWDVGVLNRSLAIINYPNWGMEKSFDIWVMKEYGVNESWTKQLTIGPIFGPYCPLGFWKNGSLFLENVFDKQLVLYDPNTQEIEKFQVYFPAPVTMRAVIYVESLVPINGRQEHEDERFVHLPTQMVDV